MKPVETVENYVQTNFLSESGIIKPTSPREIKKLIRQLATRKSPGHDSIPNIVLKHLTPKAHAFLATTLNTCLRLGYFPATWKVAHILLFLKPGKNPHVPSSYRPISLLCTILKVFEKIISKRLNDFLITKNIIPKFQFGFRRKHSTSHQLTRLTEIIERGFESKKHTLVAFLDFSQAFDKVWIKGLVYKLLQLETPAYLLRIIASFLMNRTFAVKINAELSNKREIKAGVPQGSILGPILFNIYVSDITASPETHLAMYADDTAVIAQHDNIIEGAIQLQEAVNHITNWCDKWYLQLNPQKCETKIFTLRRPNNPLNIKINNCEINWNPRDRAIRYLGLHLDRRLTWGIHINKKLNECHTRLVQLYPIINRKSSLKIECALLIYKSLLRPIITYGCTVWGAASKTQINKIQVLQNKILRIATNAPWFIRNKHLHDELGVPTIRHFIRKCNKKFFQNITSCPGAAHYSVGNKNLHVRLKRLLPQDMPVTSDDSDESN